MNLAEKCCNFLNTTNSLRETRDEFKPFMAAMWKAPEFQGVKAILTLFEDDSIFALTDTGDTLEAWAFGNAKEMIALTLFEPSPHDPAARALAHITKELFRKSIKSVKKETEAPLNVH